MPKLTEHTFYAIDEVPEAFRNEGKPLSLTAYALKRNCNMSAVQTHIKKGNLSEGLSYIRFGNDSEKPRYAFNFEAAQNEWAENVRERSVRVDKNFNKTPRARGRTKKTPEQERNSAKYAPNKNKISSNNSNTIVKSSDGEIRASDIPGFEDFPDEVSAGEIYQLSKSAEAYYKAQTVKVKLDEEKKDLIRVEDVKMVLSKFFVEIKQKHLAINSRLKTLIGKENADLVKEEIEIMLIELSKAGVDL